jgi:1-acyl-sn-glycerol-3-phosphate acyltransferase
LLRRLAGGLLGVSRVALRLGAMTWVTLACWAVLELGALAAGRRRRHAWGSRVFRVWSRLLGGILGQRLEVSGRPPPAPYLLVSNHLSYVDVLLLGGAAGGTFVAKREIASWPVIGPLCRAIGTVFIDRGAKRDLVRVAREVEGALAAGKGVVVFPEGTTGDGSALLPFKPALLEVAAAGERPVAWAVIRYQTPPGAPPAAEAVCWTGGQRLVPHALRLLALPGFRAHVHFAAEPVADADRKRLAHRLREAMAARLAAG